MIYQKCGLYARIAHIGKFANHHTTVWQRNGNIEHLIKARVKSNERNTGTTFVFDMFVYGFLRWCFWIYVCKEYGREKKKKRTTRNHYQTMLINSLKADFEKYISEKDGNQQ